MNSLLYQEYLPEIKNEVYWKAYLAFIKEHKNDIFKKEDYTEKHHIVPSCYLLDKEKKKDKNNLIRLKARYHFIAHKLLFYAFRDDPTSFALFMMTNTKQNGKREWLTPLEYEEVKIAQAKFMSEKLRGKNNPNYGKHLSEEYKKAISIGTKKAMAIMTTEQRDKLRGRRGLSTIRKGYKLTKEEKNYVSIGTKKAMAKLTPEQRGLGQKRTLEQIKNISDAHKGVVSRPKGFHLSEEQKKRVSETIKGSRWMYKDKKSLQVKSFELQAHLDKGFVLGRNFNPVTDLNLKWVHNNKKNIRVPEKDLKSYLEKGYLKGRIKKEK